MKQTITILSVVMAALLLASGFMVTNSMEQSRIITEQSTLLSGLRDKLQKAEKALNEQALNDETLGVALANMTEERDAAVRALEESNAAATAQSQALLDAQATHALEKERLENAVRQKQATMDELDAALTETLAERDEAIARAEGLDYELAAQQEVAIAASQSGEDERAAQRAEYEEQLAALQREKDEALESAGKEANAFIALLKLWYGAQLGQAELADADDAAMAFALDYPQSAYRLPEEPAEPTRQPEPTADAPNATASAKPTATVRPATIPAPSQTLPPVWNDLP